MIRFSVIVLCLLAAIGCQPRRHHANIVNLTANESAHQEVCSAAGAIILEVDDLELECGATFGEPTTDVEIGRSLDLTGAVQAAVGASHYCEPHGVGLLPCLEETDTFTIEVAANLDDLSEHNDLVDNGQFELDIRLQGDGARLKFLRRVRTSWGSRWEEVSTTTLPFEKFLGPRTFAGKFEASTMSVYIDGELVASHYSPERTKDRCESTEVGKGCFGRIQRVALLIGAPVDLADSSDAFVLGDVFVRGDVNADGRVDNTDVKIIRDQVALASTHLPCLEASDVNNDGNLDYLDIIALIQLTSGVEGGAVPLFERDEDGDDLTCVQFN